MLSSLDTCTHFCPIFYSGFTMDASNLPFHPTAVCPSKHQIIEVDAGSPADEAGLKTGDFLLEVNVWLA